MLKKPHDSYRGSRSNGRKFKMCIFTTGLFYGDAEVQLVTDKEI